MPAGTPLFTVEQGGGSGAPLVFLHGFAAASFVWKRLQAVFSADRPTLAYDLPGHGRSSASDGIGGAGRMARALVADLDRRGVDRVHLAGHSMGGAVAAIVAIKQPDRVASLTMLAPGGFGSEINHRLLRRYALAGDAETLSESLEDMFGWNADIPSGLASGLLAARSHVGVRDNLQAIMDSIFFAEGRGFVQGTIRRSLLFGLKMPVKVLWGTQDRVLPTRQSHRLPALFAAHIFEDTGHMLIEERPEEVEILIRQAIASASE